MKSKRNTYPDELTAKMHSELQVSDETDRKHTTWSALDAIADGDMTRREAIEEYGVTKADLVKYGLEWKKLSFQI